MYRKRNNELEIIALYRGNYRARFYLRQISRLLKMPLKTCQNALAGLEKGKVLKAKPEGKNKYFTLNQENLRAKSFLLQAEIHKTDAFLDTYPEFKMFLKALPANVVVVLFGSFAKMTAGKDSDADILTITGKQESLPFHLLPYKVHQVALSESAFLKSLAEQEPLIKEIEQNHIILNNHSFYVNAMWGYYGKVSMVL